MTTHRLVWAGIVLFGIALMGVAIMQAMGLAVVNEAEPAVASAEGPEVTPAGAGVPAQPRWTGVLAFGGVVAGIGFLGFALAGGFGAVADFMRSDE